MGEPIIPLDRGGDWLHPAICWFDRRTEPQARWWREQLGARRIYSITGQPVSFLLSLNAMLWIREHEPEVFRRARRWLVVEDYLNYRLTGVCATDYSIASRTMGFDVVRKCWSEEIFAAADLDPAVMPEPFRKRHAGRQRAPRGRGTDRTGAWNHCSYWWPRPWMRQPARGSAAPGLDPELHGHLRRDARRARRPAAERRRLRGGNPGLPAPAAGEIPGDGQHPVRRRRPGLVSGPLRNRLQRRRAAYRSQRIRPAAGVRGARPGPCRRPVLAAQRARRAHRRGRPRRLRGDPRLAHRRRLRARAGGGHLLRDPAPHRHLRTPVRHLRGAHGGGGAGPRARRSGPSCGPT